MLADTRPENIDPVEAPQPNSSGTERVARALIDVQASIGRVADALSRAQARNEAADGPSTIPANEKD